MMSAPTERISTESFRLSELINAGTEPPTRSSETSLANEVAELERKRILETLERFAGNQTQAARALGVSRGTLIARMELYSIPRPRKREG
jgi:two-component system, NtrC family, response regulator AtoC